MRLLVISECYPSKKQPQYCVFIKQQLDELRKLGYDVSMLVPIRNGSEVTLSLHHDTTDDRYVITYKPDRYEVMLRCSGQPVLDALDYICRKKRIDLIAVHITSDTVLCAAIMVGQKYGIPVIQHYHGLNVWKNIKEKHPLRVELYARRRKRLLIDCTAIVGVSDKVVRVVQEKLHETPVYRVYNGVDLRFFFPKTQGDINKENLNKIRIITVANLIPIKGIDLLIQAFARLHKEHENTHLEIVGEGPMLVELQKLAETLNVLEVVQFSGRLPYEMVAQHMQNSDIFVLPSFYEAIGCVYLEAMGCGIPVIGVYDMGIDEVIIDGINGLLVKPNNVDSIYQKMKSLVVDKNLLRRLGLAGHDTVKRYTWTASAKALNFVYNQYVK